MCAPVVEADGPAIMQELDTSSISFNTQRFNSSPTEASSRTLWPIVRSIAACLADVPTSCTILSLCEQFEFDWMIGDMCLNFVYPPCMCTAVGGSRTVGVQIHPPPYWMVSLRIYKARPFLASLSSPSFEYLLPSLSLPTQGRLLKLSS